MRVPGAPDHVAAQVRRPEAVWTWMNLFAEHGLSTPVEPTAPVVAPTRRGGYQGPAATGTGPTRSSAGWAAGSALKGC